MDRAEAEALEANQNASTMTLTSRTRFTAWLLCRMHKDWLGERLRGLIVPHPAPRERTRVPLSPAVWYHSGRQRYSL